MVHSRLDPGNLNRIYDLVSSDLAIFYHISPIPFLTLSLMDADYKFNSGANTDLLGRRWFLVGGNVICFIGHLVAGTARNANAVIAGMALTGFGGANCQMAAFALPELLPSE